MTKEYKQLGLFDLHCYICKNELDYDILVGNDLLPREFATCVHCFLKHTKKVEELVDRHLKSKASQS